MKNLIEALSIMLKYGDVQFPTHCEHDVMYVFPAVRYEDFSADDLARLHELGFEYNSDGDEGFMSYLYGSC